MKESGYRENGGHCYFHPKENLVGVCPLCLNERLLVLAAKQGLNSKSSKLASTFNKTRSYANLYKSKPSVSLPKIFALGSLFSRRDIRPPGRPKPDDDDDDFVDFADDLDTTSSSLEDESFISIKFGDNGVALWDKKSSSTSNTNTVASKEVSLQHCGASQTLVKHGTTQGSWNTTVNINNNGDNSKCVVDHVRPRAPLRWRNRIGQLLQVIRWERSSKANTGGGSSSKVEGVKMMRNNKGWIRTLRIRAK